MTLLNTLAGLRTPILDIIMGVFSFIGGDVFLICALALCFWCYDKRLAYRITFTYVLAGTIGQLLSVTLRIPNPWTMDPQLKPEGINVPPAAYYSMPAQRAVNAGSLAMNFLIRDSHAWNKVIAVIVLLAVPFSGLYFGQITLIDAGAGLLIAVIVSILVNAYIDKTMIDRVQYFKIMLLFLICPFVLLFVSLAFYYNELIGYEALDSAVKYCGIFAALIISWYIESAHIRFTVKCDRWWKQFLKAVLGLAILFGLNAGLKAVFSLFGISFWPGTFLRFFLVTGAAFGAYPLLIKLLFRPKY